MSKKQPRARVVHPDGGVANIDLATWLAVEKAKIEEDERFHYKPANVLVNAYLALEQVGMKARHRTLCEIEKILETR